jgi:DNA mismatch repair protein MutL
MINCKIQQLSDETIDQIAAGEVVENPAAVVKELFENAIDAGATKIIVEILGGGFSSIRISDNGIGMNSLEAKLCFQRHTTSKLREINDLSTISSMGFRGEALASVASIAKVELQTREEGSCEGTKIIIHGGKVLVEEVCARGRGTTIAVQSLFYNTPARKSFQKSETMAISDIVKVMTKSALAFPECSIRLVSNGKVLLEVEGMPFEKKVKEVLGFKEAAIVNFEDKGYYISGLVGAPHETRVNRAGQYLFVNKRPVHSYMISAAVLEGYGTRIDAKRFPIFALHLDLPGHLVDVNVHPQKSEVRFKEEKIVAEMIRKAVSLAWQKGEAPEFIFPERQAPGFSFEYEPKVLRDAPYLPSLKIEEKIQAPSVKAKSIELIHLLGKYALFSSLDLTEEEHGTYLIDLLAARARLVFDQALNAMNEQKEIGFDIEQFMFPEVLEFSSQDSILIEGHLSILQKVGILLRPFGKGAFLLEGLTSFIRKEQVRDFLLEITRIDSMMVTKIAETASYYARKGKISFSKESAKTLIEKFYRSNSVPHCPKGRPIVINYQEQVLERLF